MTTSKLVRPSSEYKESYLDALKEYHGEERYLYQDVDDLDENFDTFIKELSAEKGYPHQPYQDWVEPVQETVVWMVRNKDYIGTVDIRHRLNWHLEKWGGHVHFVIRPSLRGSGLGEIMLRKALPIINYIGIDEALFTVDLDNSWAIHILEKLINELGGQFEDETPATDKFPAQRRYWLNCS